jgi:hypothetical protein
MSGLVIDLAVMCKETYAISTLTPVYTVHLNTVSLTYAAFMTYFFTNGNFMINSSLMTTANKVIIGFDGQALNPDINPDYKEVELYLYNCILTFAAKDLDVSINEITPGCKIEIYKEVTGINLESFNISSALRGHDISLPTVDEEKTYIISAVIANKNCKIKPIIVKFYFKTIV